MAIWVFLHMSVQDIDAFQSCGELHGKRKSTCWLSVPPPALSSRDLLYYQTLTAYCEFGLRPGLHKQWMWTEPSKGVATDILGFIHFALHLHGGCVKAFLIIVSWNSKLLQNKCCITFSSHLQCLVLKGNLTHHVVYIFTCRTLYTSHSWPTHLFLWKK